MSLTDLLLAAIAVAAVLSLWGLSLTRRLRRIVRHSKLDPLTKLGSGHWLDSEPWPAAGKPWSCGVSPCGRCFSVSLA